MPTLITLPSEILRNIINNISDPADVASCCFVCKILWNFAAPLIYCDLDLTSVGEKHAAPLLYCVTSELENHRALQSAVAKDRARQIRLIKSLANPKLARFVQTFRNHQQRIVSRRDDGIDRCKSKDLLAVATNMKSLRHAWLKSNVLGAHILGNLDSYPHLTELHVNGLKWQDYIWPPFITTALTSLTWVVENRESQMARIPALLNIIESTCPLLKSLDIGFTTSNLKPVTTNPSSRIPPTNHLPTNKAFPKHLQHLGIRAGIGVDSCILPNQELRDFIERHKESLTSLSIPYNQEDILALCESLPKLKTLALSSCFAGYRCLDRDGSRLSSFLPGMLKRLTDLGRTIESITLEDNTYQIKPRTFAAFGLCSGLKVLRLGDWDWGSQMWNLNFGEWVHDLISVIPELPLSLEEFYFDATEFFTPSRHIDFHPVLLVVKPLFTSLRQLRVCDIYTWNYDVNGRKCEFPSQGLHCRRLHNDGSKVKVQWISKKTRSISCDDISQRCFVFKLGDGEDVCDRDITALKAQKATRMRLQTYPLYSRDL